MATIVPTERRPTTWTGGRRWSPLGPVWHLLGLLVAALTLGPFAWMIVSSFKTARDLIRIPPGFFPRVWTTASYQEILDSLPFVRYYANSLVVSSLLTVAIVVSSSLVGFVFAKYQFRAKEVCFVLILSTLMIPFAVIVVPLYLLVADLQLRDSYAGLVVPFALSSFGIFLMRQFMEGIPNDLIDAARLDGAPDLWIWARIVVPLSKTAASALAVFTFLWAWNQIWWPAMITRSNEMRTLPLGIVSLNWENGARYDLSLAGAAMAVVPVILIFALAQRTIVRGVALSGMKG